MVVPVQPTPKATSPVGADPWRQLSALTPARIGLGRAGGSLPTRPLLEFQLAHAQARDAVEHALDAGQLARDLAERGFETLRLHSAAQDRRIFIARPDLGRILDAESKRVLEAFAAGNRAYDCIFVVADGLSALAIERHVSTLLAEVSARLCADAWRVAPVAIVEQGRVAIGDEIGALLGARMAIVLIGERPGLSSPDSVGAYLTYDPLPGRTNAERNCISNIRTPHGLSYALAAHKLHHLMTEAFKRRISGVTLKEDAPALESGTVLAPPAGGDG